MKEQLVEQLKTQISDLERFIQYLHGEATCPCDCPKMSKGETESFPKCNHSHYKEEDEEEVS